MEKILEAHLSSGEWLKDLFDHAHDLIQLAHLDGTLIYVNQAWSGLLGYQPHEIIGKSIYSFIDEADRPRYISYRNSIMQEAPSATFIVFDMVTKHQERIAVEGTVSVKKLEGKPVYTRGIFRDISVRVQQEAQLREINAQLQERQQSLEQMLLYAPDAVIVADRESRITFWNRKAEEVFGWKATEVIHQSLSAAIIPPQYREAHERGMNRYLTTGEERVLNKSIEITALNKKGEEFYVSLTISRAFTKEKIAFIAFLRDITAQKQNQLELEKKTKQLELTNENLQAFAYAASHDLKEPLRKIHIFSDRLREKWKEKLDPSDANYFSRIESATTRMRALIDDLLDYSTIRTNGKATEEVNLQQLLEEVVVDLELAIHEKGATVKTDPLPVIKGQQRQWQQAFQNLLDNALKYSRQNIPPRIHIRYRLISSNELPKKMLTKDVRQLFHLIQVEDNGIGFDPEDAERIFHVFTRLYGSQDYHGTGIGLAIVQKVVEAHQGLIWADSEVGKGTVFSILLPKAGGEAGQERVGYW